MLALSSYNKFSKSNQRRFWSKVHIRKKKNCWIWKGSTDRDGYGLFGYQAKTNKWVGISANRFSLELKTGRELEEGECALHSCDNPSCVNPSHLFAGTGKKNRKDCCNKGRQAKGETQWKALATEKIVKQLRRDYKKGKSVKLLMIKTGLKKSTIEHIIARRTWRHVK